MIIELGKYNEIGELLIENQATGLKGHMLLGWRLEGICNYGSCLHGGGRDGDANRAQMLSQSIPNAKSHSLTSPIPFPGLLLQPHLGSLKLPRLVLITPNWIPWTTPCHIPTYCLNSSQNFPPHPQRCSGLPRSCGHHVMIAQVHHL